MTRFFHSWILAHSRTAAAFGVCAVLIFTLAACGYKAKPFYEPSSTKSDKKSQNNAPDSQILDSQAQDSKTPNSQTQGAQKNQKIHTIQGIDSHTIGEDEGD